MLLLPVLMVVITHRLLPQCKVNSLHHTGPHSSQCFPVNLVFSSYLSYFPYLFVNAPAISYANILMELKDDRPLGPLGIMLNKKGNV